MALLSHRFHTIRLLLVLAGAPALPVCAQFVQQGGKLTGSDAGLPSYQGSSVALSSDGNTLLVGGYLDKDKQGAAWVFTRSEGVWKQQGPKLVGSGGQGINYQGIRVGLSADGNTALVGGDGDNGNAGAAWVFTRSNGAWTQQGGKLVGANAAGSAYQGLSVALSGDGNTALVGGTADNNFIGAAWVWTRVSGTWSQQAKLVGRDWTGPASGQGFSLALSSDGNTALVGAWFDNNNSGAAWVFTRDSTGAWTQQGSKLVGSGAVGPAQQGWSVALSADGNTALVHGAADDGFTGAAWVWTRSNGVWKQQGPKLVGTGLTGPRPQLDQGNAAALSADGNLAAISRANDSAGLGAVWIFTRDAAGVWTQQGQRFTGTGSSGNALQGYSVALSADGHTLAEGGPGDANNSGAAWVFAAGPQISAAGILNAASARAGAIAPNEYISILGTALGPAAGVSAAAPAALLAGTRVYIGGTPAPLTYTQAGQINALVPWEVAGGQNTTIQVEFNGVKGNTLSLPVAASSPGIFSQTYGPGQAWVVNQDGAFNSSSNPAARHSYISFWLTGQGMVDPAQQNGAQPSGPPFPAPLSPVSVTLGNVPVPGSNVVFAGLVYSGVFQMNLIVPDDAPAGAAVPLVVTIGGASSRPDTTIAIQ